MKITLKKVEYTTKNPKTGLWFQIAKLKTEHKRKVEEIQSIGKKAEKFSAEKLNEKEQIELDLIINEINTKSDELKLFLLETKIKIIVDAFDNKEVNKENILKYLNLQDVSKIFYEIDFELDNILAGRMAELPN